MIQLNISRLLAFGCLIGMLLLEVACSRSSTDNTPAPAQSKPPIALSSLTYLADTQFIGAYTASQVVDLFPAQAAFFLGGLAKQPVWAYAITYRTKYFNDSLILASGLVVIPQNLENLSILSLQHGTILKADESSAPSYLKPTTEGAITAFFASTGYIACAPDYIGYGASKMLPHPYEHAASLASATRDMVLATTELAKVLYVPLNNKLYLTGYSQGGTATLAAQQAIEATTNFQLQIAAVSAGAGAYDKPAFADYIVKQNTNLSFLNYYVWVLQTYNKVYKLGRADSVFFKKPYDSLLALNPFAIVPTNPQILFTQFLREGISLKTDVELLATFDKNDLTRWIPVSKTLLVHGSADTFVPLFNSQNAYNRFIQAGAKQVSLKVIPNTDHSTTYLNYLLETIRLFNSP